MSKLSKIYKISKIILFFLLLGGICVLLIGKTGAQAQLLTPFFNPFWSTVSNVNLIPFSPFTPSSPFLASPFLNPFFSPFSSTGFPAFPGTTSPTASVLGTLIPTPPLPIATVAGTTVIAPTTVTDVIVRIWLGGPPVSLTLPVPTTIYIIPSATASGLLIPPPSIPPSVPLI